jgi:hypothetical protein
MQLLLCKLENAVSTAAYDHALLLLPVADVVTQGREAAADGPQHSFRVPRVHGV